MSEQQQARAGRLQRSHSVSSEAATPRSASHQAGVQPGSAHYADSKVQNSSIFRPGCAWPPVLRRHCFMFWTVHACRCRSVISLAQLLPLRVM